MGRIPTWLDEVDPDFGLYRYTLSPYDGSGNGDYEYYLAMQAVDLTPSALQPLADAYQARVDEWSTETESEETWARYFRVLAIVEEQRGPQPWMSGATAAGSDGRWLDPVAEVLRRLRPATYRLRARILPLWGGQP